MMHSFGRTLPALVGEKLDRSSFLGGEDAVAGVVSSVADSMSASISKIQLLSKINFLFLASIVV